MRCADQWLGLRRNAIPIRLRSQCPLEISTLRDSLLVGGQTTLVGMQPGHASHVAFTCVGACHYDWASKGAGQQACQSRA